jgi:hypothetical protein
MKLLLKDSNPKTRKGMKKGFSTYTLTMLPSKEICPYSDHCMKTCLSCAGRGKMKMIINARARKRDLYLKQRDLFNSILEREIEKIKPATTNWIRLNTMSDIDYHEMIKKNKGKNFYDYTKDFEKVCNNDLDNYHLTFSFDGHNWNKCQKILEGKSANVAIVFSDALPKVYKGFKVVNGDVDDLRFLDPKGVIVGLKFKGSKASKAKAIKSGFCVNS